MDIKTVTICIANYNGHEALQLTIESILRRTDYPYYKILIYHSGESNQDREYLEKMKRQYPNKIDYIASKRPRGHGYAVTKMLKIADTDAACIMDNDCEILSSDWLSLLIEKVTEENIVGVAKFKGSKYIWMTPNVVMIPYYWLACMLLVLPQYRKIDYPDNWIRKKVPYLEYKKCGKEIQPIEEKGNIENYYVYYDTGARFTERLLGNHDLKITSLPNTFLQSKLKHYGGISRNSHRRGLSHIQSKLKQICKNLEKLRERENG